MFSCLEGWLFCHQTLMQKKTQSFAKTYFPERLYQCQAECPVVKPSMLMLMLLFGPFWHHSNILFWFLNPLPSQKLWVASCKTCQESTVLQGQGTGCATHQSTCPWSSREEHQELCRGSLTSCRHLHRNQCSPLNVWLHLKRATCSFPPTSTEQGCQCCSDSGGPSRFALSCWAGPGESVLSNRYGVKIAEQQQAWSRGLCLVHCRESLS